MSTDVAIVFDCGSTNAAAIAVDSQGQIVGSASYPNVQRPQLVGGAGDDRPAKEGWRMWDLEEVGDKLGRASQQVCGQLDTNRIKAVTVTTFGADGAPVRADGTLTYPVISWQDERTEQLAKDITGDISAADIFNLTGYQIISFSSILRLMWLRHNAPAALDEADSWLMMPGLLSMKLCGEKSIEPTSAGTMMAMDMGQRDWSEQMLSLAQVDDSFFPTWVEPGEVIGLVHAQAAEQTGLPEGIPVVAAGHDTQFAAIGSGARPGEAILSSGTWEILMLRLDRFQPNQLGFQEGLLFECDAVPGWWNPQLLMMGSAVLEWIRHQFFSTITDRHEAYPQMIAAAQQIDPGSDGVTVIPSFVSDTGPTKKYHTQGTILGLEPQTSGAHIYRAGLEGLSFQMYSALNILAQAVGFQPQGIRVVSGGSRNELWNQIRADVTGLPVTTIAQREATVLGAALFAFVGAEVFSSVDEAIDQVQMNESTFEPSTASDVYPDLYQRYLQVPPALSDFYS